MNEVEIIVINNNNNEETTIIINTTDKDDCEIETEILENFENRDIIDVVYQSGDDVMEDIINRVLCQINS